MSQYCNFGTDRGALAYVREELDGYSVSFHENEALPSFVVEQFATIDVIKAKYSGYTWREPDEEDECDGDILLIGE